MKQHTTLKFEVMNTVSCFKRFNCISGNLNLQKELDCVADYEDNLNTIKTKASWAQHQTVLAPTLHPQNQPDIGLLSV